ncbi:MAG TPA: molecular chaperone DnaJ [Polyangiaceae bacterium]|nr:molecular chaperone DnaJ [Polyangiaceae bacterium]
MSVKRDYYEVLGVSSTATAEEIRKAYKQSALKNHPDRNPGDAQAEMRFKEATEAYAVLTDDQKRATYDRFGHEGLNGAGVDVGVNDILSHFQEMFSDFFGGAATGSRRRRNDRGQDVRVSAELTLAEAMHGGKHEVVVRGAAPCETCSGTGAKAGTSPTRCTQCRGSGQVTAQRGFIMFASPCARCRGTGSMIESPCDSCGGAGAVEKQRKVLVSFPPGIDSGQRLRVPNQGMPGPAGTPAGDLYVDVELTPHEQFERQGDDLGTRVRVSFAKAALGGQVDVVLPNDAVVTAELPPGTQPGTVVVVRGQGMPRIDRSGRGSLHVAVDVVVPSKLTKRAKKLIKELDEELVQDGGAEVHAS